MTTRYRLTVVVNGQHQKVASNLTAAELQAAMNRWEGRCERMFYQRD